jgi:hypothetical protein
VPTNIRCCVVAVRCHPLKNPNATQTDGGPALDGPCPRRRRGAGIAVVRPCRGSLVSLATDTTHTSESQGSNRAGSAHGAGGIVAAHGCARARRNGLLHSRIVASASSCAVTGGVTRRRSRMTQTSVISLAVRDSSTTQERRSIDELAARETYRESPPAQTRATASHHHTTRSAASRAVHMQDLRRREATCVTRRADPSGTEHGQRPVFLPTKRLGVHA